MIDPKSSYDEWHQHLSVDKEAKTPWHDMVRNYLDPEKDLLDKRLLEVGCGRGDFSLWLAAQEIHPKEIYAADISDTAVKKAREASMQTGMHDIRWGVADIMRLPYQEGFFDTVISCETIEHVLQPKRAVSELSRVLKKGGRLFLTVPNYLNIWLFYRAYLRMSGRRFEEAGQPINKLMFLPAACAMVRRAGLRILHVDGVCHYIPSLPNRPAVELKALEKVRWLSRWIASQTIVVAEKL